MNLYLVSILIYLALYFLDIIFYLSLSGASGADILYMFSFLIHTPAYITIFILLCFALLSKPINRESYFKFFSIIFLILLLDGIKFISYGNGHPFVLYNLVFDPFIKKNKQEKLEEDIKKANDDKLVFREDIFKKSKTISAIRKNFTFYKFKTTKLELLNGFDNSPFNNLTFTGEREYNTIEITTKYNSIIEFETIEGNISFFLLNGIVQNCIYSENLLAVNSRFIKKCLHRAEYYDGFFDSIIQAYCSQRNESFQKIYKCM